MVVDPDRKRAGARRENLDVHRFIDDDIGDREPVGERG